MVEKTVLDKLTLWEQPKKNGLEYKFIVFNTSESWPGSENLKKPNPQEKRNTKGEPNFLFFFLLKVLLFVTGYSEAEKQEGVARKLRSEGYLG